MTDVKHILFVNQSPNRMLNDIASVYQQKGWKTSLFCGISPPETSGFDSVFNATPYNRRGFKNRVTSWFRFYNEIKKFLNNSASFQRVFLVSNPPFNLFLSGLIKKNNPNTGVDLLIYDLYPEVVEASGNKFISRLMFPWKALNSKHFNLADQVYTPSMSLAKAVNKYYKGNINVVYNWVDVKEFVPVPKSENMYLEKIGAGNELHLLYSGNLGKSHDTRTILDTAIRISPAEARFIFIGNGEGMDNLRSEARGLKQFHFDDLQPEDMFPHSLASGDVAIVSYLDGAEGYSIPSKLPYYFATGTPVIMIGNHESELADIIIKNRLGWVIPNGKYDQLISLIKTITPQLLAPYKKVTTEFVKKEWSAVNAEKFYHP